jgi:hypothetical protein
VVVGYVLQQFAQVVVDRVEPWQWICVVVVHYAFP